MQENVIPAWGLPLLALVGICIVIVIVGGAIVAKRTKRTKAAAQDMGIRLDGVRAFKSFRVGVPSNLLVDQVREVVQNHPRFSRFETVSNGVHVYVRGNIWTWGEIIELRFAEDSQGTEISASCRPRLRTTLVDYGQNGKDLALFIDLLLQQTGAVQRRKPS